MAEIFISYSSKDVERAQTLADALSARDWSVWWDRKIPLGMSYDQVIEKALAEAKCVIVLWSAVSAASEWVRNEASEAKRRGILIPVFIEQVDAPLAFRLLNGADLSGWRSDDANQEFDQLLERVTELLGQPHADPSIGPSGHTSPVTTRSESTTNWFRSPAALVGFAAIIVAAAFG